MTILENNATVPYASRSWAERATQLGEQAELSFEQWAKGNGVVYERMGFRGSALPRAALLQLPPSVRHLPDYLAWKDGELKWVECIGTADRLSFKIRESKHGSQWYWHRDLPLAYFIFCSSNDSFGWTTWDEVAEEIRGCSPEYFADGNSFHRVPISNLRPING